jgi:hypothetical protein
MSIPLREKSVMKQARLAVLVVLSLGFGGCGGGSDTGSSGSTSLAGNWTITANQANSTSSSVFQVALVSSACSVSTPIGTFTVQGPSCFIADDNSGQGSITGTGSFIYPPQGVLLGATVSPVPSGQTASINLLFVEADQFGDAAVFSGTGTVTSASGSGTAALSGNWECASNSPACVGLSGTFSGTQ